MASTGPHTGQTIGGCHPQIVVTMGRDDALFDTHHIRQNPTDQVGIFFAGGKPDRIGDIEGGGTFGNHSGQYLIEIGRFRASGIHGGKFNIVAE